jgi:hypothetical protein
MANLYYDDSADLALIQSKKVAIIGYGSQGHAHSLNLRDSGVSVRVGLPEGSASRGKAEKEGLTVNTPAQAAEWADVIMILAPDTKQPKLYRDAIDFNCSSRNAAPFFVHIKMATCAAPMLACGIRVATSLVTGMDSLGCRDDGLRNWTNGLPAPRRIFNGPRG